MYPRRRCPAARRREAPARRRVEPPPRRSTSGAKPRAPSTAFTASIRPQPDWGSAIAVPKGTALWCTMSCTSAGVRAGFASSISATAPAWGAAAEVPKNVFGNPPAPVTETPSSAATSGFGLSPSAGVLIVEGPRELNFSTVLLPESFAEIAPTASTSETAAWPVTESPATVSALARVPKNTQARTAGRFRTPAGPAGRNQTGSSAGLPRWDRHRRPVAH